MKKVILGTCLSIFCLQASAQSGTNSPYSQYGLGTLASHATGFNRGMNGVGYGFHESNQVNYLNPASYASIDSLTFIFDAGLSLQLTNFEENNRKINAQNANLEYIVASFRAFKNLGVSFGILPYTNVGYNFSNTENVNAFPNPSSASTTYSNVYSGDGGLRMIYLGAGWSPFKGFSIGANAAYLWGQLNRSSVNSYSDASVNTLSRIYSTEVKSYKIDFGAQYTQKLTKKDEVSLGVAYTIGHSLGAKANASVISNNTESGAIPDTTSYVIDRALSLPSAIGVGLMWNHDNHIKIGVDYQLQSWANLSVPQLRDINGTTQYVMVGNAFKDRHKVVLGGEYYRGERSRNFFSRIHYRAGVGYATPYLLINGQQGPRELSASIGLGIPIINGYNNRSLLNISAEWVNLNATGLIRENMFRINVGLTFNERWFAKFKVD